MFFIKSSNDINKYTIISNKFFEKILPYIDAKNAKIYLFAFYVSQHQDMFRDMNNDSLAEVLNMDVSEILQAWDFFESLNLIKKHRKYNANSKDFSVEFLNLGETSEKEINLNVALEPLDYINMENTSIKNMYEQIEEITKIPLSHYEIRQIDSFLINFSVSYDVIVEAFKYAYFTKKKRSVRDALLELKEWIKSGVKTSRELDLKLEEQNRRYNLYRKVLKRFGEYRLPTVPEMEHIDRWTIEYNFDFPVIKKAIDMSIAIKNPNFKYVNGILSNWKKAYDLKEKKTVNEEDILRFNSFIASYLGKKLSNEDEKTLRFLFINYDKKELNDAIKEVEKSNDFVKNLFDLLINKSPDISFGKIGLNELGEIVDRKAYKEKELQQKRSYKPKIGKSHDINKIYGEEEGDKEKRVLSKNRLKEFLEVNDADKK